MPDQGQIRWELADRPTPQGRLFGDLVEREMGKGEFRGLEFLHVRAKTIINQVPEAARVPFRYTVNVYRGCSHACSYCLSGDTPILMADGGTKPLAEVRAGEAVYGTEGRGTDRRYVVTPVRDHWSEVKPAYEVSLEDGTKLVASADHRFLTDRGWKHVTGSRQGGEGRPHLASNDRLTGTGRFSEGPKRGSEYRGGYLCGVVLGYGHVGPGTVRRFRPAMAGFGAPDRAQGYPARPGVLTDRFLLPVAGGRRAEAARARAGAEMDTVGGIVGWPEEPSSEWCKGFLAGVFDAGGSYRGAILRISSVDPGTIDRVVRCLSRLGFSYVLEGFRPVATVRLRGGLREHLRFFHTVDPAVSSKRRIAGVPLESDASLGVVSIEALGFDLPMYDITTGTGDFIADGVVSHNCFARPTHEYLGLGAGEDFERKIVVKVNAVDLLRAETEPGRWAGGHIAMGTNTDPYQRAEGKYKLTRGVVEVLTERGNPFSILTKNTLVLRDLDLLGEAAGRGGVTVNFSIGTLDEEVWRTSEPNTPHPLRRIEAVARLNQAGIPCGVLVAPVIPGMSDSPEQLEAVVKAAVDAGARSIYSILLHLRPGVKEHFMPWLAGERPDLLPSYRRLYRRSYAPSGVQEGLAEQVRELVEHHGGPVSRGNSRGIGRRERDDDDEGASQLRLGL